MSQLTLRLLSHRPRDLRPFERKLRRKLMARLDYAKHKDEPRVRDPEKERQYKRNYYLKNRERLHAIRRAHEQLFPEKTKARELVKTAIKTGRLVRGPCEICGSTNGVQAHHKNYALPLEVTWRCRSCHAKEHNAINYIHKRGPQPNWRPTLVALACGIMEQNKSVEK